MVKKEAVEAAACEIVPTLSGRASCLMLLRKQLPCFLTQGSNLSVQMTRPKGRQARLQQLVDAANTQAPPSLPHTLR